MLTRVKYAIRSTIRHHASLRSDAVIKKIAGIVEPRHKVNLTSPDKVILVEVFQVSPTASDRTPSGLVEQPR